MAFCLASTLVVANGSTKYNSLPLNSSISLHSWRHAYEEKYVLEEIINSLYHSDTALESGVFIIASATHSKHMSDETRPGAHGYTVQFCMLYVDYIRLYHKFTS